MKDYFADSAKFKQAAANSNQTFLKPSSSADKLQQSFKAKRNEQERHTIHLAMQQRALATLNKAKLALENLQNHHSSEEEDFYHITNNSNHHKPRSYNLPLHNNWTEPHENSMQEEQHDGKLNICVSTLIYMYIFV